MRQGDPYVELSRDKLNFLLFVIYSMQNDISISIVSSNRSK